MIHEIAFGRAENNIANLRLDLKSICKRTSLLSTKKGGTPLVPHPPFTLDYISPEIQEVFSRICQPLFGNVG